MVPSWVASVARGLAAAACFAGILALSIEAGAGAAIFKGAAIRSGEELFRTNCAACHGTEARGDGPLAKLLERQPSDLTMLSKKNDGFFPFLRVRPSG